MSPAFGTHPYVKIDRQHGTFRVLRRAFVDQSVFELEKKRIFERCWLYVGHESEVAQPGQFQIRFAGTREVIFNRDLKGKVNVFLNSCPHRGARLCTEHSGVAKGFFCYYHGWSFAADGKLRGLPDKEAFARDFNHDGSADMVSVARVENYRGLYFVCFDPTTVSLSDYLGNAKPYIDLCLDQGELGMEVVPGSHDYAIRANWKTLAENGVDGNHAMALHASYWDYVKTVSPPTVTAAPTAPASKSPVPGSMLDLGGGHTVLEYAVPWGRVSGKWWPAWGEETKAPIEAVYARLVARVGAERAHRIASFSRNLLIFPNLTIVDSTGLTLRIAHPHTVDHMYVNSYALAAKGEDDALRKQRLAGFVEFLGPGGYATPDDVEALEQCQRAYMASADLPLWNDLSKGAITAKEWPINYEGSVRCFWSEWDRRLDDPAVSIAAA